MSVLRSSILKEGIVPTTFWNHSKRRAKLKYSALAGLPLALQVLSGGTVILFYTLHLPGLYVCYKVL